MLNLPTAVQSGAKPRERWCDMSKELMGTLSPLYGMATGEGVFGNAAAGVLPAIAARMRKDKEREQEDAMRLIEEQERQEKGMKKGGKVKKMKKGGTVSSASKRADGIATKGKTKGRFV
jgi:hypothetical protein